MITRAVLPISMAGFAASLFARAVDPIIPPIAADLSVDPKLVALLSSAFALPFAMFTPIFGPLSDILGKGRLITAGLALLVLSGVAAALAPDFPTLMASRIAAGIAAGSVFPIAIALIGDLVPVAQRQVALGRMLMVVMSGTVLGASVSGVIGDLVGWRGVFLTMTLFGALALIAVPFALRGLKLPRPAPVALKEMPGIYRDILANPRARVCFTAVLIEGAAVFGLLPYVALLLHSAGEDRASIAGLVIAAFSIGGIGYTVLVGRMLTLWSPMRLMLVGGSLVAAALLAIAGSLPWIWQFVAFLVVGFGFYSLHGYLQVQVTELSPARGAATSLHSTSFFLGQAIGPALYAVGFAHVGAGVSVLIASACFLGLAIVLPRLLAENPDIPAARPAE